MFQVASVNVFSPNTAILSADKLMIKSIFRHAVYVTPLSISLHPEKLGERNDRLADYYRLLNTEKFWAKLYAVFHSFYLVIACIKKHGLLRAQT